jgi:ATP-dependent 26S proteasome regulatory subunit
MPSNAELLLTAEKQLKEYEDMIGVLQNPPGFFGTILDVMDNKILVSSPKLGVFITSVPHKRIMSLDKIKPGKSVLLDI